MKKIMISAVIFFYLLSVVGCTNKTDTSGSDKTLSPTATIAENTPKTNINDDSKDLLQNESSEESSVDFEDILPFIPDGWHVLVKNDGNLAIAEGDLNQDDLIDKAFVIEGEDKQTKEEFYVPPRSLLIAFRNSDNTYSLSIKSDKAIMLRNQGGVFGDPFQDIKIERGTLLLEFYGGSNYRWYLYYRFKYQDDGWYLIGVTKGSYFTGTATMETADEEDYNLLTGDYTIKKYEDGQLKTTKGNRGKRPLVNLKDFVPGEEGSQF
ncbi:MAG TPA: hypothetical protein PKY26_09185 [Acetivibrio clariflavus]|nr:hypothetical protein [Acetivibrio clariflavus]